MKNIKALLVLLALSFYVPNAMACACSADSAQEDEDQSMSMQSQGQNQFNGDEDLNAVGDVNISPASGG